MSLGHLVRGLAVVVCCAGFVGCSDTSSPDEQGETLPDEVRVIVGEKGGMVQGKGVSLEIPAGALDKDVMISAKKIDTDKVTLPAEAKDLVSGVYEFGPKGTTFNKEVTVKIDTDKDEPQAKVFFTKEGSDTEFEKLASTNDGKSVAAKTKHFSLGFAGIPADAGNFDAGVGGPDAGNPGSMDAGLGEPDAGDTGGMDSGLGTRTDAGAIDSGAPFKDGSVSVPDGGTGQPDAAVADTTIIVSSTNPWGAPANQTWFAYQDGNGPWQELSAASTGSYIFKVSSPRYGLAYVCSGSASSGQVLFAPASHAAVFIKQMAYCTGSGPTQVSRSGSITPPTNPTAGNFRYAHKWYNNLKGWSNPSDLSYSMDKLVANQASDIVFGIDSGGAPIRINVFRNIKLPSSDFQGVNLDTGGFAPQAETLNVSGVVSAAPQAYVEFTVSNADLGMKISDNPVPAGSTATVNFKTLPNANRIPSDRLHFVASDSPDSSHTHTVEAYTTAGSPYAVTLPVDFSASLLQSGGYDHFAPEANFDDDPGATEYTLGFNYVAVPNAHIFTVHAEAGWFPVGETIHSIKFPQELVSLPNFQAGWLPATTSTVKNASAGVVKVSTAGLTTTRTTSEVLADLPASFPP
ncbi:MAG: hypothetical protein QM778_27665 [Myxococcales bacterium]